jgi:hypothetical protein
MKSSCVNNEIKSFNRKLMKSVRAYQHASILEVSNDRKLFTNHGLHLNGLGKEVLSKQIVSLTYAILDQKKDPHPPYSYAGTRMQVTPPPHKKTLKLINKH